MAKLENEFFFVSYHKQIAHSNVFRKHLFVFREWESANVLEIALHFQISVFKFHFVADLYFTAEHKPVAEMTASYKTYNASKTSNWSSEYLVAHSFQINHGKSKWRGEFSRGSCREMPHSNFWMKFNEIYFREWQWLTAFLLNCLMFNLMYLVILRFIFYVHKLDLL